jgi:hypothetical protein
MHIFKNYYLYSIILLFLGFSFYPPDNEIVDVYVNWSIRMGHSDVIKMNVVVCIIDMVIVALLNFLYK